MDVPSIRELRKYCKHEEGELWNMRLFRLISVYPLKLILYLPISANMLSYAWMFLGLIGALMLIPGDYWLALAGMILYQFAYLIDQLDGPVARIKKQVNLGGDYLDELTAYLHRYVLLVALGIGAYFRFDDVLYLWLGFIAAGFVLLDQVMKLKSFQILVVNKKFEDLKKFAEVSKGRKSKYFELVVEFFRPQALSAFLFFAVFDILHILLIISAVMLPLIYFKTVYSGYKNMKKLSS